MRPIRGSSTGEPGEGRLVDPVVANESAQASLDLLELIAGGITDLVGFRVAVISIARGDGSLHRVAIAGSEDARKALAGTRTPVASLAAEVEKADDWGLFKFVPHERTADGDFPFSWVPDLAPVDHADAWHPLDLLVAPLLDRDGTLRGSLSIDLPTSGRRPDAAQRELLEKFAAQARRAVLAALEHEHLAEQVRLAHTARDIVRQASAELGLERLVEVTRDALMDGFRAKSLWIHTFGHQELGGEGVYVHGDAAPVPRELLNLAAAQACAAWAEQQTHPMSRDRVLEHLTGVAGRDLVGQLKDGLGGVRSFLFVPLGAGQECLGSLTLTRHQHAPDWAEVECATALDIGHDLGRAILNARTFDHERRLHAELRTVDAYKSQLIATVAHELKSPLTSVIGNLELLESVDAVRAAGSRQLAAAQRGAQRLGQVTEDLLLLSRVSKPDGTPRERVDLTRTAREALDLTTVMADHRGQTINADLPTHPVITHGDAEELGRVAVNLISNAIKYSPEHSTITLTVAIDGARAVLSVADQGIGIAPDDQERLFSEFFRSSNPAAVAQPGTRAGARHRQTHRATPPRTHPRQLRARRGKHLPSGASP